MKFKRVTGSALGLLAVGGVAWGCSGQASDCTANEDCGAFAGSVGNAGSDSSGGNAGTSAGGGDGKSGASAASGSGGLSASGAGGDGGEGGSGVAPCDATSEPTAESCLVSDDYAVFVAPSGDDSNEGSMSEPLATIAQAINVAQAAGKFVVACDGTYDEQVSISASVALYGGFTCPGGSGSAWQAETGGRAKVTPSVRGIALTVKSSTAPVQIEDFEFDAQDGVESGESSIAALLDGATKVTLTRVKLVAGKGIDGASGTLTPVTFPTMLNGNAASGDTGGASNVIACPAGGTSKGGKGGDGASNATGGGLGTPAITGGGAAGVLGANCGGASPSGTGGDGMPASPQLPSSGATKLGSITPTGWIGYPGADGTPGTPGQGGGGGTGADAGGGGGGGAAGGCGGAGGTGGKAGGSSIALALLDSTIALSACELIAANAGRGGDGIAGQGGQNITANGGLPDAAGGCQGGKGGAGGSGGAGGGAAGGISVGIAYQGSGDPPSPDAETVITVGKPGDKGIGGVSGTNNGIDGNAQTVFEVQ